MSQLKVALIGCGNISDIYLKSLKRFSNLEVVACSSRHLERAQEKARQYGIAKGCLPEEIYQDSSIDLVLNLTVPKAHLEISLKALEAGKHLYNEKPLGLTCAEGKHLLSVAKEKGLLVGCAPDTFLGAALQTCRELVDQGAIGRPTAANLFFTTRGTESWHPNPSFYYEVGGGPLYDMAPYYLTALISLVGPVKRVCGASSRAFEERIAANGDVLPVETDTHVSGLLEFQNGLIANLVTSFDICRPEASMFELYGTEGSLRIPAPYGFGGAVEISTLTSKQWQDVPLTHGFAEESRGLGVADLIAAIEEGREPRASGAMAYHVLEVMEALSDSSGFVEIASSVERPAPMPKNAPFLKQFIEI